MMSGGASASILTIALLIALNLLLLSLLIGLIRAWLGPSVEDRFSAILLMGTGGVAMLFILAILLQVAALYDVALVLALLAVVGAVALTQSENRHD
ncbi:MAG: monovalent cation/H+ antiporter complex subunit F [Arenicellales bacterium]